MWRVGDWIWVAEWKFISGSIGVWGILNNSRGICNTPANSGRSAGVLEWSGGVEYRQAPLQAGVPKLNSGTEYIRYSASIADLWTIGHMTSGQAILKLSWVSWKKHSNIKHLLVAIHGLGHTFLS